MVRDLLKADRDEAYESFSAGSDGGIDLRLRSPKKNSVIQCKHYVGSGFAKLKSAMPAESARWSEEHQKEMRVYPLGHYGLATSVPLTPSRKAELEAAISATGAPQTEVLGQEDLNRLIAENTSVERRHPSLWLTSVPVLQRVLASEFFGQSDLMRERAERRLQVYVMNPSFDESRRKLEENGVCVIAGEQGVGKTCLAEVLVAQYIDRGFEAFEITADIGEMQKVFDRSKKQVFLYDDFLGMTAFEHKFNKNEESRLISLIEAIKRSENSRLILTTREYILRQAVSTYEKLDRARLSLLKFVVAMSHFDRRARAEVLYRHLCFSSLPDAALNELIRSRAYFKIVDHKNYNPRLIESMSEASKNDGFNPSDFSKQFLETLDNPLLLWQHPFENHLDKNGQDLVLTVCSFPHSVALEDLNVAVAAYSKLSPIAVAGRDERRSVEESLRIVEGSFLSIDAVKASPVVGVMQNAVRDYCEGWFDERDVECENLLLSAVRFEQVEWAIQQANSGRRKGFAHAIERNPQALCNAAIRTIDKPSCTAWIRPASWEVGSWTPERNQSKADRLVIFLGTDELLPEELFRATVGQLLQIAFEPGYPRDSSAGDVIEALKASCSISPELSTQIENILSKLGEDIIERFDDTYDVQEFLSLCDESLFPLHGEVEGAFKSGFARSVQRVAGDGSKYSNSKDWNAERYNIQEIAERFEVDVSEPLSLIDARIIELKEREAKPPSRDEDTYDPFEMPKQSVSDAELELMFSSLTEDHKLSLDGPSRIPESLGHRV